MDKKTLALLGFLMAGSPNVEAQDLDPVAVESREQSDITVLLGRHANIGDMEDIVENLDDISGGILYVEGPRSVDQAKMQIDYADAFNGSYDLIMSDSYYLEEIAKNYTSNYSKLLLECAKRDIKLRPFEVYDKDILKEHSKLQRQLTFAKRRGMSIGGEKGKDLYLSKCAEYVRFRDQFIPGFMSDAIANSDSGKPVAFFIGLAHASAVDNFQENYGGNTQITQLIDTPSQ